MASRKLSAVGAGAAALMLVVPATQSQARLTQSSSFKVAGAMAAQTILVQESSFADGSRSGKWTVPGTTVTVAGPPGLTVAIDRQVTTKVGSTIGASATAPPADKSKGAALADEYRAAGRSVYKDALRAGISEADARKIAASLHVDIATGQSTADRSAGKYRVGDTYNSWCVALHGDGEDAFGDACIVQSFLQIDGGNWYLSDEMVGTASDQSSINSLNAFSAVNTYPPGNVVVKYKPNQTIDVGQCQDNTQSLGWHGIGISSSTRVCPGRLSPVRTADSRSFGERWTGCAKDNENIGLDPIDVVHSPAGAMPDSVLYVSMGWTWWCN